MITGPLYT